MKILIIAAHPDDAEIAMGMKIQDHLTKGDYVHIHCLSQGGYYGDHMKEIRMQECQESAQVLGVLYYSFSDITDTEFTNERTLIRDAIQQLVEEVQPDIYYTHYHDDLHLDHIVTSQESLTMTKSVPTIVYFKSPYSRNFKPNLFFIGDEVLMNKKLQAIKCFETQTIANHTNEMKHYASIAHVDYIPLPALANLKRDSGYDVVYTEQFYVERMITY